MILTTHKYSLNINAHNKKRIYFTVGNLSVSKLSDSYLKMQMHYVICTDFHFRGTLL